MAGGITPVLLVAYFYQLTEPAEKYNFCNGIGLQKSFNPNTG